MSEFGSWMQDNWQDLGTLATQLAFLIAAVWFARNFLKVIRALQEQVGAVLKLLATGSDRVAPVQGDSAKEALAQGISSWLAPSKTTATQPSEPVASGSNPFVLACCHLVLWMQTPTSATGAAPWRRVIRWLQPPVGS